MIYTITEVHAANYPLRFSTLIFSYRHNPTVTNTCLFSFTSYCNSLIQTDAALRQQKLTRNIPPAISHWLSMQFLVR